MTFILSVGSQHEWRLLLIWLHRVFTQDLNICSINICSSYRWWHWGLEKWRWRWRSDSAAGRVESQWTLLPFWLSCIKLCWHVLGDLIQSSGFPVYVVSEYRVHGSNLSLSLSTRHGHAAACWHHHFSQHINLTSPYESSFHSSFLHLLLRCLPSWKLAPFITEAQVWESQAWLCSFTAHTENISKTQEIKIPRIQPPLPTSTMTSLLLYSQDSAIPPPLLRILWCPCILFRMLFSYLTFVFHVQTYLSMLNLKPVNSMCSRPVGIGQSGALEGSCAFG